MRHDCYYPEVDRDRLIEACVRKIVADPEGAGVHQGPKGGSVPLADWRAWVLSVASEKSSAVLAYEANPLVIPVELGDETIPFPADFKVTTAAGHHMVAFDIPGLRDHELAVLLGMAASACRTRLVHITDEDLDAFVEGGRFPARSTAAAMFAPPDKSTPPPRP